LQEWRFQQRRADNVVQQHRTRVGGEQIQSLALPGALYQASKSAVTMLSVQYARQLPNVRINVVDPGYTATDLNANSGPQTVTEGTDAIVAMATIGADGPTGTFTDRDGTVAW
jgi:NAD(P)-dependent dehydrogenase (short-subunit alcohol dehydrogenase family)